MLKPFIYFAIVFAWLLPRSFHCYGQTHTVDTIGDFATREKVLFDDDFGSGIADSFPSNWSLKPCDGVAYRNNQYCHVRKIDGHNALVIIAHDLPFKDNNIMGDLLSPNIYKTDYLPDSFTLQYDFLMGSKDAIPVMSFSYENPCFSFPFRIYYKNDEGWVFEANIPTDMGSVQHEPEEKMEVVKISGTFEWNKWHHFELSFYHQRIKCFLDNKAIWGMLICNCDPYRFILSANGEDSVAYANFMSRTGKYIIAREDINKLLTDKKFVTHAIHFDVNKWVIKQESMDFVKQFAEWLKQNTTIKLEIDGHTDSDGNAAENIKLSKDRADEVKKQLMLLGIDSGRLTTRGYGATKPLRDNATEEGKGENRRVEFVRR